MPARIFQPPCGFSQPEPPTPPNRWGNYIYFRQKSGFVVADRKMIWRQWRHVFIVTANVIPRKKAPDELPQDQLGLDLPT